MEEKEPKSEIEEKGAPHFTDISELREIGDELLAEKHTVDLSHLPDDMSRWMQLTIATIDRCNLWVGKVVGWLILPTVFVMVYEISARYFFLAPTMWAYDLSRMFYGALFTLGSAYALSEGIHIRADFIYRNWKPVNQARVDLILYLCFFFPGMIMFFLSSIDFAMEAWGRGERGMDTAWMPVVYPIKSVLPISIFLLLIQGVSEVLKCWYSMRKGKWFYES